MEPSDKSKTIKKILLERQIRMFGSEKTTARQNTLTPFKEIKKTAFYPRSFFIWFLYKVKIT